MSLQRLNGRQQLQLEDVKRRFGSDLVGCFAAAAAVVVAAAVVGESVAGAVDAAVVVGVAGGFDLAEL